MKTLRELKNQDTIEINIQTLRDIEKELTENKVSVEIYTFFKSGVIKYLEYLDNVNTYIYFDFIDATHVRLQSYQYNKQTYNFNFIFDTTLEYSNEQYKISKCSVGPNVIKDNQIIIEEIAKIESCFMLTMGYFYRILKNTCPINETLLPSKKVELSIDKLKIIPSSEEFKEKLIDQYYTKTVAGYYRTMKDGTQKYIKPHKRRINTKIAV